MRIKLFFGWYIVIAGLLLTIYTGALFSYGWTAFVNPILATFGWSFTQLSLASSLRGLETGVFNPVWGVIVDRRSPRNLLIFGLLFTALGIFVISRTANLGMYYAGFLVSGIGSSLATWTIPTVVITRWFKKDLGKASGLLAMGVGIGGVLVPLVVKLVDNLGWQTTLMFSAAGLLVLGIPLSFLFRSRPADYGLLPDGKAEEPQNEMRPARMYDFGTSVKDSFKMRAFWHISSLTVVQFAMTSVLMLYFIPYLTSVGIERATAGTIVMFYTLISLSGRIPFGILSDKYKISLMTALSIGLMAAGMFIFLLIGARSPFWLILLFAIIYGLGLSGMTVLKPPLLAEYFGTRKFGAIYGLNSVFTTIGSVVAPVLAGWVFDTWGGNNNKVWMAAVALGVTAVVLMLTMPAASRGRDRYARPAPAG